MERRFELRLEEMLQECEVSPELMQGVAERLNQFVEPFAALLTQLYLATPSDLVLAGRLVLGAGIASRKKKSRRR
jgi:hypothetical protein